MKKARVIISILALALAAGACTSSITAPDCQSPTSGCSIIPGPNT